MNDPSENTPHTGGWEGQQDLKRSIVKQPPSRFTVALLPPSKQTGSSQHLFGMRITSLGNFKSRASTMSTMSEQEYDVWRRWEDWLWLQETIDEEYSHLARSKRQRLLAGKGIKRGGMYMHADRASSWDSLPFGPDPNSIEQDVSKLIPTLTRKATLFRAKQETIDQRFAEIKAFLEALFHEDQPTLIQDLRGDRIITDFFGIWRRDVDLQRKHDKEEARRILASVSSGRSSVGSSVFSAYFANASVPSVDSQSTPAKTRKFSFSSLSPSSPPRAEAKRNESDTRSIAASVASRTSDLPALQLDVPVVVTTHRYKARSRLSTSSSSTSSSGSSTSSGRSSITGDSPVPFRYNSQYDHRPGLSGLSALPEDEEIQGRANVSRVPFDRRPMATPGKRARRSAQIVESQSLDITRAMHDMDIGSREHNRESWQSNLSGMSAIADMGVTMPSTRSRQSVSSMATFMTDDSVDAIVPRSHLRPRESNISLRRANSMGDAPNSARPWSEGDGNLDDFFFTDTGRPESVSSMFTIGERPISSLDQYRPISSQTLSDMDFILPFDSGNLSDQEVPMTARTIMPPSPTRSTFSIASTTISNASSAASFASSLSSVSTMMSSFSPSIEKPLSPTAPVTVKAAFNKTIIIFRATRDIPFNDARQRIRDKFRVQERVNLSESFCVALAMQESVRSRNSVVSLANEGELRLVTNHEEWKWVMSYITHGKITIRILDDEAMLAP